MPPPCRAPTTTTLRSSRASAPRAPLRRHRPRGAGPVRGRVPDRARPGGRAQGSFDRAILACVQGGMAELAPAWRRAARQGGSDPARRGGGRGGGAGRGGRRGRRGRAGAAAPARRARHRRGRPLLRDAFGPGEVGSGRPGRARVARALRAGVELRPTTGGEVIDGADWETRRDGFLAGQPVIGRPAMAAGRTGRRTRSLSPSDGRRTRRFLAGIDLLVTPRRGAVVAPAGRRGHGRRRAGGGVAGARARVRRRLPVRDAGHRAGAGGGARRRSRSLRRATRRRLSFAAEQLGLTRTRGGWRS